MNGHVNRSRRPQALTRECLPSLGKAPQLEQKGPVAVERVESVIRWVPDKEPFPVAWHNAVACMHTWMHASVWTCARACVRARVLWTCNRVDVRRAADLIVGRMLSKQRSRIGS